MSLFSSLMGDIESDPFFGSHMRTVRHMNNMMNSLLGNPFEYMGMNDFGMQAIPFGNRTNSQNSLLPLGGGYSPIPNINRIISNSLDSLADSHCYSSSTVVSMSSGPDGRPHVYKATSSTRTAPGGVRETQNTMCDSRSGTKKMSIGHHIGERAHIIEREQNVHSGDREERQDFINIEEDDAEEFNKEWETRARPRSEIPHITGSSILRNRHSYGHGTGREHSGVPAITAGPSRRSRDRHNNVSPMVTSRRGIRSNALVLPSTNTRYSRKH